MRELNDELMVRAMDGWGGSKMSDNWENWVRSKETDGVKKNGKEVLRELVNWLRNNSLAIIVSAVMLFGFAWVFDYLVR